MAAKHLGDLLDRIELAADSPAMPASEKSSPPTASPVRPEVPEVFFDRPGTARLQVRSLNRQHLIVAVFIKVVLVVKKQLTKSRQWAVAIFLQLSMFRPPDLVDCFSEVLRDVKLVMNDLRVWNMRRRTGHERLPHVHRNGLNSTKLLFRKRFPELIASGDRPIANHLKHSALVNVGQNRDVIMTLAEALFIHADMLDIFGFSTLKSSLYTGSHDGMGRVPGQTKQACRSTDIGCRLKNADRERLEHQRKARVLSRPRNRDRFDPAAGTSATWYGDLDFSRELHRIEVPPSSLGSGVGAWTGLGTRGAAELAAGVLKVDDDSTGREIQIHVNDFPIVAEPKKLSVVCVEIVHPNKILNPRAPRDQTLKFPKNLHWLYWRRNGEFYDLVREWSIQKKMGILRRTVLVADDPGCKVALA